MKDVDAILGELDRICSGVDLKGQAGKLRKINGKGVLASSSAAKAVLCLERAIDALVEAKELLLQVEGSTEAGISETVEPSPTTPQDLLPGSKPSKPVEFVEVLENGEAESDSVSVVGGDSLRLDSADEISVRTVKGG